jgi:integrase
MKDGSGAEKKPRRNYGNGSIYFRKSDNRYVGSFYHDGERKYVYGSVGGKKEEVKQKLKESMRQAEQGTLVASNKQKVSEYLEHWLSVKKIPLKAGTYATHSTFVHSQMIPHLGKIQLQRLSKNHVQHFIKVMLEEEDLEPSTIHTIYTILSSAMNDAVESQLLSANPCKKVVLPHVEDRDYQVLDSEQVQTLLTALVEHPLEGLITLALATGMRRGELLGLKWSDIDMERGRLRVQRTVIRINGQGYLENTPKTKGSRRTITLTRSALDALKEHRKRQLQERLQPAEWNNELDLVFPGRNGKYFPFPTLAEQFARVLTLAGLPKMRFHDLRHTCATLLLSMSISPKVVSELLGHSSIKITMDRYGHVIPGMQETAMNQYDVLLKRRDVDRAEIN